MINVREIVSEDYDRLKHIFDFINENMGMLSLEHYLLRWKDKEYFVSYLLTDEGNNVFWLTDVDRKDLDDVDDTFLVDDSGLFIKGTIDGYTYDFNEGFANRRNYFNDISECLRLAIKADNVVDSDGFKAIVCYTQYDEEKDRSVSIIYQHHLNIENRIYKQSLKLPFQFIFEEHVSDNLRKGSNKLYEIYIKRSIDFRKEPLLFKIATLKDFGVGALVGNHVVSLQGSDRITRYYKALHQTKSGLVLTSFPMGSQYREEDFYEELKKRGFNTSVPEMLIDFYNGNCEQVKSYEQIAKVILEYRKANKGITLNFKRSNIDVTNC